MNRVGKLVVVVIVMAINAIMQSLHQNTFGGRPSITARPVGPPSTLLYSILLFTHQLKGPSRDEAADHMGDHNGHSRPIPKAAPPPLPAQFIYVYIQHWPFGFHILNAPWNFIVNIPRLRVP
jgi:hypothetical protein